jgi:hypothetical protein
MWFLHDGAPAHFGRAGGVVGQALSRTSDRSGSEAHVPWPPRSPDLNPIDFYLWGSMKNVAYANTVDTRDQPWQRIQDAANKIRTTPGVLEHVRASVRHRADTCVHTHGWHFEHL